VLAGGTIFLHQSWRPGYSLTWLGLTSIAMLYLLRVLWLGLEKNHRPGEEALLPSLGAGNLMTLLRGVLLACLAGFLFSPRPPGILAWIPAVLYTLAIAADFLDGYLARVTNHATCLGEMLDMSFDGVGILGAALLAVQYGQAPAWYLSVALARYLFLAGIWVRRKQGKPLFELPPSIRRRAFAGLQMGFIAALLWPIFTPPGTYIAAVFFALPFLAGFTHDWLVASGVIQPASRPVSQALRSAVRWLPVLLRLAAMFLAAGPLSQRFLNFSQQVAFFADRGMPSAGAGVFLLSALEAAVLLLLLAGAAGRSAAVLGLLLLGLNQFFTSLTLSQIALLVVYTAILFLGTGALSLWTPEDRLIYHKAGERRVRPSQAEGA
jgi:CDP-diacylglycerol--glycerol-3-phosphate 3-phosphatidyltransferase